MRKFILLIVVVFSLLFSVNFNVKAQDNGYVTVNRGIGLSYRDITEIQEIRENNSYILYIFEDFLISKFGINRDNEGDYEQPVILYLDSNDEVFEMTNEEDLDFRLFQGYPIIFNVIDDDLYIYVRFHPPMEALVKDGDEYYFVNYETQYYYPLKNHFNAAGFYLDIEITIPSGNLDYDEIYSIAFEEGKRRGYDEGYDVGYDIGFDEGNIIGYDDGYVVGYDDGYVVGYDKALENSNIDQFIANFDKWIVPAIIVVMLLGGYFSVRRQKMEEL